jgi:DNA-binding transcriptional LysR family regulator
MPKAVDWESRIGRRVRLRDLHVLSAVIERGSMAKAAAQMGVTQSAVSQVIADLEYVLGVRLLDRSPRGVEATDYGNILLRRSSAAFDELRHGIQEIEFLTDHAVGQVRVGCPESISSAILPPIVDQFFQKYPRAALDVDDVNFGTLSPLRNRSVDLVLARGGRGFADDHFFDDLNVETLFEDELVIAVGPQSRWSGRRKIDIAELANERWILTGPDLWNYTIVAEAFRARGLDMPDIAMRTLSVHLRTNLIATGDFITALPRSVLHLYADRFSLKALTLDLPVRPWPVEIVTLKHRTLSPVVDRFIACAHEVAKSFGAPPRPRGRKK